MSQPWYTGGPDLGGLLAQFQPSEEERRQAQLQAIAQFGLGLLGTRKGQEFDRLGLSGLNATANYGHNLASIPQMKMQQMAAASQAVGLQDQLQKMQTEQAYNQAMRDYKPPTPMGQAMSQAPSLAPTPGNVAQVSQAAASVPQPGMYERLNQMADYLEQKGLPQKAQDYRVLAEKYAPQYGDTETLMQNGKPVVVQKFKNRPAQVLADFSPKPDYKQVDTGSSVGFVDPLLNMRGPTFNKTLAPNEAAMLPIHQGQLDVSRANLQLNRNADQRAAAAANGNRPQWDATSGMFVYPPSEQSPEGRAVQPSGYAKNQKPPIEYQKQITGMTNLNDGINNYLEHLKDFGITDTMSPGARAKMGTAYNNMMLQAKEAYNLGVLNGPDYEILQSVVTDPTSMKGAFTSNEALAGQASALQEIMRRNAANAAAVHKQPMPDVAQGLKIRSDAEYNALPSGAVYTAPDGTQRRKK